MASRAAVLCCFLALLSPAGAFAEQTSASDPVERLSCSDVFDGSEASQAYIDRIVGFAFSDHEDSRLSKWPNGLRIVVRADAMPQDFVLDAIEDFRAALPHVSDFNAIAHFDWANHGRFKDGVLLVYLTWHRNTDREAAKERYRALLQEFYGSVLIKGIDAIIGSQEDLPFVGVVRTADGAVRRAVVVIDLEYAQLGRQPAVLQLLTTAINPNSGNAISLGLPGSTPAEQRIYGKAWLSKVSYELSWTREFDVYLELLLGRGVTSGMTKEQFTDAAQLFLGQPRMKRHLAQLYDCTGN